MKKILTKKKLGEMSDNDLLDWILFEFSKELPPQSELSRRTQKLRLTKVKYRNY